MAAWHDVKRFDVLRKADSVYHSLEVTEKRAVGIKFDSFKTY